MTRSKARISWTQLRDLFAGEWVELVDFRWEWNSPTPAWAVIRHHASDRKALLKKIAESGEREDALILYLGATNPLVQHQDAVANL